MKSKIIIKLAWLISIVFALYSCEDLLNQKPQSALSPESYFLEASQLETYANGLYTSILPNGQGLLYDHSTDNQANVDWAAKFVPGEWKVVQSNGGNWNFYNIYNCNYFLDAVIPRYEAGTLTGSPEDIKRYIGEVYFLRAFEYFTRYQLYGDFPIVTKTLPDNLEVLTEAVKRSPRNEVARFILSDLDNAYELMKNSSSSLRTRITKEAALLIKSRVALYEGTFLKYFKGTAFVPNGTNWPGATKEYNQNYVFPAGSIDAEINFFLDAAIDASQKLADGVALTSNTGKVRQDVSEPDNPYMDMYVNPAGYPEVLLWRDYSLGLFVVHYMGQYTQWGNSQLGLTRGFAESFLMKNGLPIYAAGSTYAGDDYIADVRKNRDDRLFLFLKEPGQKNTLYGPNSEVSQPTESYPNVIGLLGSAGQRYTTGYALRKYHSWDGEQTKEGTSGYGLPVFRSVEALLNYIEAYYERNGSLDATATQYWKQIRTRAKVDADFDKTIAATDMNKEALNDWGAYSAGQLIDPTLYNIRRERRCEFVGEGMRWMDLQRWRACDQMITTPYHIEGIKIWGPMQDWYKDGFGNSQLTYGLDVPGALMSPPDRSEYLRPYEKAQGSLALDGYRWKMAHYLNPIALQDVLITSKDNELSTSPLYQNPGWSFTVGEGAKE